MFESAAATDFKDPALNEAKDLVDCILSRCTLLTTVRGFLLCTEGTASQRVSACVYFGYLTHIQDSRVRPIWSQMQQIKSEVSQLFEGKQFSATPCGSTTHTLGPSVCVGLKKKNMDVLHRGLNAVG